MFTRFSTDPIRSPGYFLSQPHQPFFLFGIVWAVILMSLFALAYKGVIPFGAFVAEFHVYGLVFVVFTHFFVGFVFTIFPRFCQTETIPGVRYIGLFYLFQAGALLLIAGGIVGGLLFLIAKSVLLAAHAWVVWELWRIYTKGATTHATRDPFWILCAFCLGLLANGLFWLETFTSNLGTVAVKTAFNLYLLFLVFAVAQRMVPFFSHVMMTKSPYVTPAVFWLLAVKTVAGSLMLAQIEIVIDAVLALILIREFWRWKLPLFHSPAILWVLYLGLFWFPVGLLLGAFGEIMALFGQTHTLFLQTHLLAIGFVTTMLVGFGTRVALGHSGQPLHADRFTTGIFWFVQAVVALRALYSIQTAAVWEMGWLFDLSFTAWVLLFLLWGWRYAPVLYSGKRPGKG
jgi:uncharacterized protein involved in response to NO